MESLFGLAVGARVLAVHIQTVSATIDLRRAHPNEIEQLAIEARLTNLPFQAEHGVDDAWIDVLGIDSSLHMSSPPLIKTNEKSSCDTRPEPDRCHRRRVLFVYGSGAAQ